MKPILHNYQVFNVASCAMKLCTETDLRSHANQHAPGGPLVLDPQQLSLIPRLCF
jgi:hypothetical protein